MTSLAMPRAWHLLALLATLAGIAANPASAVTETYLFRDSFAPSEGAGNELVPVYNGTGTILTGGQGFVDGSFVTETISAAACSSTPTVRAWSFPQFGGLRYDNAMPVVATGSYSISMLLRFSPVSSGYARLVDFSGSTLDSGIYELDGAVSFYPLGTYATGSFVSDQDVFVTITREATSGLVALYIDGAPLPSFSDGRTSYYVPTDKVIYFLMDNTTGPANIRESEPGTIAYLQVRDTPMTAAEVAASLADICGAVAATTTTTSTTTTTLSPCGNGTIDPGETCDDGPANGTPTSCCSSGCTVSAVGPTCVALVTAPSLIRSRHAPAAIPLTVTLPAAPGKGAALVFEAAGFAAAAMHAALSGPAGSVQVTKGVHRTFRGRRRTHRVKLALNRLGTQLLKRNGSLAVTVQQQLTGKPPGGGGAGQTLVTQVTTVLQTR